MLLVQWDQRACPAQNDRERQSEHQFRELVLGVLHLVGCRDAQNENQSQTEHAQAEMTEPNRHLVQHDKVVHNLKAHAVEPTRTQGHEGVVEGFGPVLHRTVRDEHIVDGHVEPKEQRDCRHRQQQDLREREHAKALEIELQRDPYVETAELRDAPRFPQAPDETRCDEDRDRIEH